MDTNERARIVLDAIKSRRTQRHFSDKPVPPRRRSPEEFLHFNSYDGSRDLTLSGDAHFLSQTKRRRCYRIRTVVL